MVKGLGSSGKRKVGKPSFVRRFMRHKSGMFGFVLTSLFVLMALFGPLIAPYNPNQPNYAQIMAGPSMVHLLGTDIFGRDTLSRVLFGARLSLGIGVGATLIGAIIGGLWGLWSGYVGGLWDVLSMRIVDILLAFPGILLAIGIIAITGPGIGPVIIATGIFGIPIFARLVRGSVLAVKERAFIEAARALGSANTRVMFRHLMPSVILPILVYVTLRVGTVILIASGAGTSPGYWPSPAPGHSVGYRYHCDNRSGDRAGYHRHGYLWDTYLRPAGARLGVGGERTCIHRGCPGAGLGQYPGDVPAPDAQRDSADSRVRYATRRHSHSDRFRAFVSGVWSTTSGTRMGSYAFVSAVIPAGGPTDGLCTRYCDKFSRPGAEPVG